MAVPEVVPFLARYKLIKIQSICEAGGEAVSTFVVKVIELFRNIFKTKCDKAKLVDGASNLQGALKDVRSVEWTAWVSLEMASARIKTLEAQVKDANAKCTEMADETAQAEKNFCSPIFMLKLLLNSERDRSLKDARDKEVLTGWSGKLHATRCQLQEKDKALRKVREKLSAAIDKLESLRCNAKDAKKELSATRADVAIQRLLREESREQPDAELANLKEVQSQLELRKGELVTLYDQ